MFYRFGYWKKQSDDSKKFLEDKLISAKAEPSGNPKSGSSCLSDLRVDQGQGSDDFDFRDHD